MKKVRERVANFILLLCAESVIVAFLMEAGNEAARTMSDGFPLDNSTPWLIFGLVGIIVAMLIWPHPKGLKQYIKDIL